MAHYLGNAEVGEPWLALVAEQDVRWLDIEVHYALRVRQSNGLGEFARDLHGVSPRHRPRKHFIFERTTGIKRHHQIWIFGFGHAPVHNGYDVVDFFEAFHEQALALETARNRLGTAAAKHFDRNGLARFFLRCFINVRVPTRADKY